jgi:hypothetical protein
MMKEPAGTLIITMPAELLNSEAGDLDMMIRLAQQVADTAADSNG